ncbi:MAG: hypothetical protein Q8K74_10720 [Candidatus Nitrotoga sp.]|nr:hypothetical protein [Candidatus Nitrotoga sp.]MDP1856497.1 hypothetical protein [Candidatus Nitrotoga sp.]
MSKLEKRQLAKLNEKLDKLELYGDALYPDMLTGTPVAGISKIRARGNVQLRPLLCKGPVDITKEYTLLMGAKEIGNKWKPENAPTIANGKKKMIIEDSKNRRIKHERVL